MQEKYRIYICMHAHTHTGIFTGIHRLANRVENVRVNSPCCNTSTLLWFVLSALAIVFSSSEMFYFSFHFHFHTVEHQVHVQLWLYEHWKIASGEEYTRISLYILCARMPKPVTKIQKDHMMMYLIEIAIKLSFGHCFFWTFLGSSC